LAGIGRFGDRTAETEGKAVSFDITGPVCTVLILFSTLISCFPLVFKVDRSRQLYHNSQGSLNHRHSHKSQVLSPPIGHWDGGWEPFGVVQPSVQAKQTDVPSAASEKPKAGPVIERGRLPVIGQLGIPVPLIVLFRQLFFDISQKAQCLNRAATGGRFSDQGVCLATERRWEVTEEGLQLGGEEAHGDQVGELGKETAEGEKRHEGVASTGIERLSGQAYLKRQIVGLFDDKISETFEVGPGEGAAVAAVFEGVKVAGRRASATGAEFVVAVSAAAGLVAHGPGAAARNLTGGFVRVSRHGCSIEL